ncbi:MAG: hypothetical protein ACRD3F_11410 [Acidobacteriaceae bacterium]
MRNLVIAAVLMCPVAVWSQQNSDPAYPITVHVVSSRIMTEQQTSGRDTPVERLEVLIKGKKYALQGYAPKVTITRYGVIAPGDYAAALTDDHSKGTYLYHQEYKIKFPDGKTAKFKLIGESE